MDYRSSIIQRLCLALLLISVVFSVGCIDSNREDSAQLDPYSGSAKHKVHNFPSKRVSVNGLSFRYLDHGEGDLVIFLHGFPYFADVWYKQMGELGKSYRTVAVDNRGYAYSDKPKNVEDYRVANMVEDVRGLIQKLSPSGRAVVVGHDWGGGVAWGLAQKYPDMVSKLVVINSPPGNIFLSVLEKSQAQRDVSQYVDRLKSPLAPYYLWFKGPEVFWGASMETMLANGDISNDFKRSYIEAWRQPGAFAGAINWYKANLPPMEDLSNGVYAIKEEDFWPSREARISVPTLLVWSDKDVAFVQETLEAIPPYIDDLTLKIIHTKSHTPFLDKHADEVNRAILDFLAEDK